MIACLGRLTRQSLDSWGNHAFCVVLLEGSSSHSAHCRFDRRGATTAAITGAPNHRRQAADASVGGAQNYEGVSRRGAIAADLVEPAVGGIWREPSTRPEAGSWPHGSFCDEQAGSRDLRCAGKVVYLYDAETNELKPDGDVRAKVGSGDAAHAAATIVYVALASNDFAQVDVGFIGQNVYLFAASEGLNAWFYALHGQQDAAAVSAALKLPDGRRPLYAQSVGYPPE